MLNDNPYQASQSPDEVNSILTKYAHAATNVLKCGTGQAGIVRYLRHVEQFSDADSLRLSYPLFDKAKARLRRTQLPKIIIAISLLVIGILGPVALYFSGFGFVFVSTLPIIAGVALWSSVITAEPLSDVQKNEINQNNKPIH